MRIVMLMKWAGATPDQYHQVRDIVDWESNPPKGSVLHVAAFDDEGIRVTDVWESAEDFNSFVQTRLMPATAAVGITNQPQVEIYPAARIFVPGFTIEPTREYA
jgi:hypothetical protein